MPRFQARTIFAMTDRAWTVMLLGTIGVVIGVAIILYPIVGLSNETQEFIKKPEFLIYLLLKCAQIAFFAIIAIPLYKSVIQLKKYFAGNKLEIAISLVLLLILLSTLPAGTSYYIPFLYELPLPHLAIKVLIFSVSWLFICLLAATGVWLVYTGLRSSFKNIKPEEEYIQLYLRFREYLQQFLWIMGMMLGLIILAVGAMNRLHIAMGRDYPLLFVLAYGASLTVILTLVYVPVYVSLVSVGRQVCDTFFKMPSIYSKSWTDVYSKRKKLEELLQLGITAGQNLRATVAILIPLLSGIISTLLG